MTIGPAPWPNPATLTAIAPTENNATQLHGIDPQRKREKQRGHYLGVFTLSMGKF